MSDQDLDRIYAALASEIQAHFGITAAGGIFRAAGLLPSGDQQHWAPLMAGLDAQFRRFGSDGKLRTIRVLGQRLMESARHDVRESVEGLLRAHGFRYLGGTFIPIDFFDEREAHYLPASSVSEISTALTRLVAGDLDGALTSACAAVETAVTDVVKRL